MDPSIVSKRVASFHFAPTSEDNSKTSAEFQRGEVRTTAFPSELNATEYPLSPPVSSVSLSSFPAVADTHPPDGLVNT